MSRLLVAKRARLLRDGNDLTLIGYGCGPETLTVQARRAAEEAQLLIGAPRVLSFFPDVPEKREAKTGAEIRSCFSYLL